MSQLINIEYNYYLKMGLGWSIYGILLDKINTDEPLEKCCEKPNLVFELEESPCYTFVSTTSLSITLKCKNCNQMTLSLETIQKRGLQQVYLFLREKQDETQKSIDIAKKLIERWNYITKLKRWNYIAKPIGNRGKPRKASVEMTDHPQKIDHSTDISVSKPCHIIWVSPTKPDINKLKKSIEKHYRLETILVEVKEDIYDDEAELPYVIEKAQQMYKGMEQMTLYGRKKTITSTN